MHVAFRPVTMVLLFGYVASTVGSDDDVRRVVIGANMMILNWNVIGGPLQTLGWELGNGTIGMNLASPVRRASFLVSRALFHLPNGIASVFFGGLAGALVFDLDFSDVNWAVVVLSVPAVLVSFATFGLLCGVGSLFLREVTAFIGVSAIYIYLLSGAIVPLDTLPRPVELYSTVVPGRWGIAALQDSLDGTGLASLWPELLAEVAVCAGHFAVVLAAFLLYERRAKARGSVDLV
jgi:ABC-2 type transport system permease protein